MKTNLLNKNLSLVAMTALLCSSANLYAQPSKKGYDTWKASALKTQIYLGGGIGIPSGSTKDNAYLGNGYGLQVGVYQPFGQKTTFSLGLQASAALNSYMKEVVVSSLAISDPATGETLSSTLSESDATHLGFSIGIGPRADFHFGNFAISPIVEASYWNLTQKEVSIRQNIPNGREGFVSYDLLSQPETKTNGFAIIPKLRLQYAIGKRIGIWGEANYTFGPSIVSSRTTLVPEGRPSELGTYSIEQLATGTASTQTVETKFRSVGVNVGISFALGKAHRDIKPKNLSIRNAPDGTSPLGDSTYVAKANDYGNTRSNRTNGVFVPGLTTANDYGNTRSNRTNGVFVPGISTDGNPSGAIPAGRPLKGISISGGSVGGKPITAKSNKNGEISLKGLQPGTYVFAFKGESVKKGRKDKFSEHIGLRVDIGVKRNGSWTNERIKKASLELTENTGNTAAQEEGISGEIKFDIEEAGDYMMVFVNEWLSKKGYDY